MTHVHRHIGAACFAGEVGYYKDGPILSWPAKAIANLTNVLRYCSNVVILFQPGNGRPGPGHGRCWCRCWCRCQCRSWCWIWCRRRPPISLNVLPELVQLHLDTPPALLLLGRLPLEEPTHCGKVRLLRFIEFGEYKDNLYGTSLESIRSVLDRSKVCLVDVHAE
ncbi:unnamed protein product, partial [Gadus morhua 'NCC']